MNALDLLITLLAAGACLGGFRLGFVARSAAWLGLVAGVALGARVAPLVVRNVGDGDPGQLLVATAVTLIVCAFLGQLLGQLGGMRLGLTARGGRAAQVDRVAGAATGIVAVVLAVWLLSPALLQVDRWPAEQARTSLLVAAIEEITPPPPEVANVVGSVMGKARWQNLIRRVSLPDTIGPPPADDLLPAESLDRWARTATVRVSHRGCGAELDGTGFVVRPGLLFTNAHVVAGASRSRVTLHFTDLAAGPSDADDDGPTKNGTVVYFDAVRDIALVRFAGDGPEPLQLAKDAAVGDQGWVYGHPGGGPLSRRTFEVHERESAELTDIYHIDVDRAPTTSRRILVFASALEGGDSGSAMLSTDSKVVGMAFAVAKDDDHPSVALGIDVVELHQALDAFDAGAGSVVVGGCFAAS